MVQTQGDEMAKKPVVFVKRKGEMFCCVVFVFPASCHSFIQTLSDISILGAKDKNLNITLKDRKV